MKGQPSVTFQARGGLGNQLFMYAMARRLALVNHVPLSIETQSGFEADFFRRNYGLDRFHIAAKEIRRPMRSQLKRKVEVGLNEMLPFRSRWFLREPEDAPNRTFDPRILSFRVVRPTFLEGYWQDERYFADIAAELKRELTFSTGHTAPNERLAARMRSTDSVAVHMRQLHGVPAGVNMPSTTIASLPLDYYRAAIAAIRQRIPQAKIYLFSDSPSHGILPIGADDAVRVQNEGEEAQFEDLWLMSQCRHFVLANSTFSWWGAWLGQNAQSVIVSPVMSEWGQRVRLPDAWRALEWRRRGGLEPERPGESGPGREPVTAGESGPAAEPLPAAESRPAVQTLEPVQSTGESRDLKSAIAAR